MIELGSGALALGHTVIIIIRLPTTTGTLSALMPGYYSVTVRCVWDRM